MSHGGSCYWSGFHKTLTSVQGNIENTCKGKKFQSFWRKIGEKLQHHVLRNIWVELKEHEQF